MDEIKYCSKALQEKKMCQESKAFPKEKYGGRWSKWKFRKRERVEDVSPNSLVLVAEKNMKNVTY